MTEKVVLLKTFWRPLLPFNCYSSRTTLLYAYSAVAKCKGNGNHGANLSAHALRHSLVGVGTYEMDERGQFIVCAMCHSTNVDDYGLRIKAKLNVWELLTGKLPYEYLTPLQAAVGVVQKGLRPAIPKNTHLKLSELLERCWQQDPAVRPDFSEIIDVLRQIAKEIGDAEYKEKHGGFLSVLRRGHH